MSAQSAILSGAVADLVGNDLIGKAKVAAHELLEDFNFKANLLSARLADQLTVGAETTVLLAGSQLDKQVKNMSQPVQQLMVACLRNSKTHLP